MTEEPIEETPYVVHKNADPVEVQIEKGKGDTDLPSRERSDQPEYSESTQDLTVGAGARMESEFLRITEEDKILPLTSVWSLLAIVLGDILDRLEEVENLAHSMSVHLGHDENFDEVMDKLNIEALNDE